MSLRLRLRWSERYDDNDGNPTVALRYHPPYTPPALGPILIGVVKRLRRDGRWMFEMFDADGYSLGAALTLMEAKDRLLDYAVTRGREEAEAATEREA